MDVVEFVGDGYLWQNIGEDEVVVGTCSPINGSCTFVPGDDSNIVPITLNMHATINYTFKRTSCDDDCDGGDCTPGTPGTKLNSLIIRVPLDTDSFGDRKNYLRVAASQPTSLLSTPESLFPFVSTNVTVVYDDDEVRQVFCPSVLADVQINDAYDYAIDLYETNVIMGQDMDGTYLLTNDPPFTTVQIVNPNGSTSSNVLEILEIRDGETNTTVFTWDGTDTWTLDSPGGLKRETLQTQWNEEHTIKTQTYSIKYTNDVTVYKEQRRYEVLEWGETLIERVVDPDGVKLTNTWEYFDSSAGYGKYTQLKQRTWPGGRWERYDYDANYRQTNRVSGFLTNDVSAADSDSHQWMTVYTNTHDTIIIEKIQNSEISRNYEFYGTDVITNIICPLPAANPYDSGNLITIISNYSTGDFEGDLASIQNPDGTMSFYEYEVSGNEKLTLEFQGEPNAALSGITNGTVIATTRGYMGELISVLATNISEGDADILLSKQMYDYPEDDTYKLSPTTVFLDGTSNQVVYGCCGIDSMIHRDGSIVYFEYDALKRRTSTARAGITNTVSYDPSGNILAEVQTGTGASQETLSQFEYDLAGRTTNEVNSLGGVTSMSFFYDASGGFVKTNLLPDTGQSVESYYRDGRLKGITGTASHPMLYEYGVETQDSKYRYYEKATVLDRSGSSTSEWTKRFFDGAQRNYRTEFAKSSSPYPAITRTYNALGQLETQQDPDGLTSIYEYSSEGELEISATASNPGTNAVNIEHDRIVKRVRDVTTISSDDVVRLRTYAWLTNVSGLSNLVHEQRISTDGLKRWDIAYNSVTNLAITSYPGSGWQVVSNITSDGSVVVRSNYYGRLISSFTGASGGTPIKLLTYSYDEHGRLASLHDARNGTTTVSVNAANLLESVQTPIPGDGSAYQRTIYTYDGLGRMTNSVMPDGERISYQYLPSGELSQIYGSRTYPVAYDYDSQGRLTAMTNWSNFASSSGERVTSWFYDGYRGYLTNKTYPNTNGPTYTYSDGGRLESRIWNRGITTYYTNDAAFGNLIGIGYSDGMTPHVAYELDRAGRRTGVETTGTSSVEVSQLLNHAGQVVILSHSSGLFSGSVVSNEFDGLLRRMTLNWSTNGNQVFTNEFRYDPFSRFSNVVNGVYLANYSYHPNSSLLDESAWSNDGAERLIESRQYDFLNRIQVLSQSTNTSSLSSSRYEYNKANQRTLQRQHDGSRWSYAYDSLGQLSVGKRYWGDGTPVAGQQFAYTYDDIGNRLTASAGGDSQGNDIRTAVYEPNEANQYTNRTVSGTVDIIGIANAQSEVEVNEESTYRYGEYYQAALTEDNSSSAVYPDFEVIAELDSVFSTNSGNIFIPLTPQVFSYDADGNLLTDGRWTYSWDAENRLTSLIALDGIPSASSNASYYAYDDWGRRISKVVSNWTGSAWALGDDLRFLYDGWNLIAELDSDGAPVRTYTWGQDLSGTLQGAGGVGGLVAMTIHVGHDAGTYFYVYDGNGNVVALVDASDGVIVAEYEYDPFGGLIRATGDLALENRFRFSTKYYDDESDLLYYGHRFYSPSLGRYLCRDPLGEKPAISLYSQCLNNLVTYVDPLGLNQEGGHYYTTYIAGVIAGQNSSSTRSLAFYSQLPDELLTTTAWHNAWETAPKVALNAVTGGIANPTFDRLQRFLHSLDGGQAVPRRNCLRDMLQDSTLKDWERGFLIHALGDAYAHSYYDTHRFLFFTSPGQIPDPPIPNPNFGKEVLYEAPFGHGRHFSAPDKVLNNVDLYSRYLLDITYTLNDGPLSLEQVKRVNEVIDVISSWSSDISLNRENRNFRDLAITSYNYPDSGYSPETTKAQAKGVLWSTTARKLGYDLPSERDIWALICRIKNKCGAK